MQKSTAPNTSFDEGAPNAGDADAVQKTTWVVGKGTDDRDDRLAEAPGETGSTADRDTPARRGTGDDAP